MPSPSNIPYRSLWLTALLTTPLLAIALASPLYIASGMPPSSLFFIGPGAIFICFSVWSANIGLLRFRERLGKWRWLQIPIIGGFMIAVSFIAIHFVQPYLSPMADRASTIRFVNAFALNAIIYVIIDLRLISESRSRLAEENARLRLSTLETQYQILKDQVNPHFLFNALGTARALARRDPSMTEAYIVRLSDFLRATLQSTQDHVRLAEELKLVRDYIELQKMRFHEALVFDCPAEITNQAFKLPYFSLLTLVENAVKHNAMTPEEPLHIRIRLDGSKISVGNNRQAKAIQAAYSGSGLSNLRQRCALLGHGEILVVEDAHTFTVSFQLLPL